MKRVVVLMSSQIAGEVFEKIRFDRSVRADYYFNSQIDQSETCKKNLKKADGMIIVDNSRINCTAVSAKAKELGLKKKAIEVIV